MEGHGRRRLSEQESECLAFWFRTGSEGLGKHRVKTWVGKKVNDNEV
jgi:hypothetical protein